MPKKVEGWQTSDGKLFTIEQHAISHENLIGIKHDLEKIILADPRMAPHHEYRLVCFFVAENRQKIFNIIKDRLD